MPQRYTADKYNGFNAVVEKTPGIHKVAHVPAIAKAIVPAPIVHEPHHHGHHYGHGHHHGHGHAHHGYGYGHHGHHGKRLKFFNRFNMKLE